MERFCTPAAKLPAAETSTQLKHEAKQAGKEWARGTAAQLLEESPAHGDDVVPVSGDHVDASKHPMDETKLQDVDTLIMEELNLLDVPQLPVTAQKPALEATLDDTTLEAEEPHVQQSIPAEPQTCSSLEKTPSDPALSLEVDGAAGPAEVAVVGETASRIGSGGKAATVSAPGPFQHANRTAFGTLDTSSIAESPPAPLSEQYSSLTHGSSLSSGNDRGEDLAALSRPVPVAESVRLKELDVIAASGIQGQAGHSTESSSPSSCGSLGASEWMQQHIPSTQTAHELLTVHVEDLEEEPCLVLRGGSDSCQLMASPSPQAGLQVCSLLQQQHHPELAVPSHAAPEQAAGAPAEEQCSSLQPCDKPGPASEPRADTIEELAALIISVMDEDSSSQAPPLAATAAPPKSAQAPASTAVKQPSTQAGLCHLADPVQTPSSAAAEFEAGLRAAVDASLSNALPACTQLRSPAAQATSSTPRQFISVVDFAAPPASTTEPERPCVAPQPHLSFQPNAPESWQRPVGAEPNHIAQQSDPRRECQAEQWPQGLPQRQGWMPGLPAHDHNAEARRANEEKLSGLLSAPSGSNAVTGFGVALQHGSASTPADARHSAAHVPPESPKSNLHENTRPSGKAAAEREAPAGPLTAMQHQTERPCQHGRQQQQSRKLPQQRQGVQVELPESIAWRLGIHETIESSEGHRIRVKPEFRHPVAAGKPRSGLRGAPQLPGNPALPGKPALAGSAAGKVSRAGGKGPLGPRVPAGATRAAGSLRLSRDTGSWAPVRQQKLAALRYRVSERRAGDSPLLESFEHCSRAARQGLSSAEAQQPSCPTGAGTGSNGAAVPLLHSFADSLVQQPPAAAALGTWEELSENVPRWVPKHGQAGNDEGGLVLESEVAAEEHVRSELRVHGLLADMTNLDECAASHVSCLWILLTNLDECAASHVSWLLTACSQ